MKNNNHEPEYFKEHIYYDVFLKEACRKKEDIAPPERYIDVFCGEGNYYIEKWYVGEDKFLNIAYTSIDRDMGFVDGIRKSLSIKYNCRLINLAAWTVPKSHFDKMINSISEGNE